MFAVVRVVIWTSDNGHCSYAMVSFDDHGAHNGLQNWSEGIGLEGTRSLLAARAFCRGSVLPYLRNTDTQARPSSLPLRLAARTIFFDGKSRDITSHSRRIFPTVDSALLRHGSVVNAPTSS